MSIKSDVSLLDLSQQFPFEINDALKKEICFGESLIISCGHYEGDIYDGNEESDTWTNRSSSTTEISEEVTVTKPKEIKKHVPKETKVKEKEEEYDNFQFFFFPDCRLPPIKKNSKNSIVMVDGMPKMNIAEKNKDICICEKDNTGKCTCFSKMPCYCGAKVKMECTCRDLEAICTCQPGPPKPVCTCHKAEPCICDPHGKIIPECICEKIDKPCICPAKKSPYPICVCKKKPTWDMTDDSVTSLLQDAEEGGGGFYDYQKELIPKDPCLCQEAEPAKRCFCKKGKDCICNVVCICGLQRLCICESTDSIAVPCRQDVNSICSCNNNLPTQCLCGAEFPDDCTCFPVKDCVCGDPDNCKCRIICDCIDPCLCDALPASAPKVCNCKIGTKLSAIVCTCPKQKNNKLRRIRATKHGYRWCNEVDPHHTYFDFAYDRHHLIETKEPEEEKFKILGLHDEEVVEDECAVHGVEAPPYKKKIRKPSLDCCSAVGGISICVESLGEDKDKFLVQVVSYSSKEGAKTGSKLVSILDCNLHTMEENRTEHITKKNKSKEKRSYMAICASGYYNKVTSICGERDVVKRFYHTFETAHDFLLEGANIVLMRYFGLSRYRGNIKTATVMMNGVICESVYVCHGVSQAIVNETPLFVVKVERHIIEPSGYIHQSLTVLTLRGYIISHEWADNCYILHLNPLLKINPHEDKIEEHAPLRSRWREDLQLLSDYLDFKSVRSSEAGRYLTESGSLTNVVRDYLEAILLLRPQDTLTFTRHYFKSVLSALDLPHDEYFDPLSQHVKYYYFEE